MSNTTVVGTLRALLVAETTQFDAALKRSTVGAQAWAKDLAAIGTQAGTIGQTLADKLTAPLAALGTTATTSFSGLRGAIEASTTDLQKLGDAFKGVAASAPGAALAGSTKTATTAVDGLSKSTKELQDVFRQLGTDAPSHIKKVGTAAKDASTGVDGIVGSAKGIAGALGIGFSVKAVIDFGSKIIDDAGHIADLSAKIGISTEAVQKFGFAAELTGASMDTVGGAIGKMNVILASGDKSTVAALDQIGLKFTDIRAMKPEDAFSAIAKAIEKIPDPMAQAEAAVKLFGKTGQELLPAIRQGLQDVADNAPVVADKFVQAADRMGDRLSTLKAQALKAGTELIGGLALMVDTSYIYVEDANKHAFQSIEENAKHAKESAAAVKAALGLDKPLTGPDALAGLPMGLGGAKTPVDDLRIAKQAVADLTTVQRENIAALEALGKSTDEIATKTGIAADVVKLYTDAQKKSADAQKKAADAVAEHTKKIADLAASLSGAGLTQKVKDLDEATQLAVKTWGDGILSSKELVSQVQALGKAGASLTPILTQVYLKHLDWYGAVDKVHVGIGNLLGDMPNYTQQMKNFMAAGPMADVTKMPVQRQVGAGDLLKGLPNLAPAFKSFTEKNLKSPWLSTMGSDFASSMPSTLMSGFSAIKGKTGDAGKQMGSQLGGTLAASATKSVVPAITKAIGGGMGKAIGGLVGNAVPIVGPIIGAVVGGLVDKAFSHKGRDAAVGFADSMGGFDELHKKLGGLGAEGEKMWVKLTGVGKRDEKGAQKIIDDIGKAFEANDAKIAAEAQKAQERLQHLTDDFGHLQNSLQVFGGVAPASLRPMIAELQKMPGLTGEMKSTLTAISQDPSWQTMQQKAQDLGIDLAALGPKFQESKLTDVALGYARDLTMFADAGADMTGVVTGMADELSTLYQEAMKNGVALPESLKPYMQSLVEMGKLVDANGEKVTDLNTVAFKDIEDKSLTDVVDVLKDIKDLLAEALPKAAADGAAKIQDTFAKHPVTIPVQYGDPGPVPTPGAATTPPPPELGLQGGTHGQFVDWGAGTPVTLHGKEAVVPYGQSAGAMSITVVSQLDGREVARNQVRYIPNELRRAGV